jgi:hypothetical protein
VLLYAGAFVAIAVSVWVRHRGRESLRSVDEPFLLREAPTNLEGHRYLCEVRSESGRRIVSIPCESIEKAISVVRWDDLGREG